MGGGIIVDKGPLDYQVGELFVAGVPEEKRLAAIADKHDGVMGKDRVTHARLLRFEMRRLPAGRAGALGKGFRKPEGSVTAEFLRPQRRSWTTFRESFASAASMLMGTPDLRSPWRPVPDLPAHTA